MVVYLCIPSVGAILFKDDEKIDADKDFEKVVYNREMSAKYSSQNEQDEKPTSSRKSIRREPAFY